MDFYHDKMKPESMFNQQKFMLTVFLAESFMYQKEYSKAVEQFEIFHKLCQTEINFLRKRQIFRKMEAKIRFNLSRNRNKQQLLRLKIVSNPCVRMDIQSFIIKVVIITILMII